MPDATLPDPTIIRESMASLMDDPDRYIDQLMSIESIGESIVVLRDTTVWDDDGAFLIVGLPHGTPDADQTHNEVRDIEAYPVPNGWTIEDTFEAVAHIAVKRACDALRDA